MKRWQGIRKSNMALVLRITIIFSWIFLLEKRHPRFATTKATVSYMPPFIDAFSAPTNLAWRNRSPRQGFRLQATTANEAVTMPSSLPTKNQHSSTVEVWDGVFSETVCGYLHDLAVDHSERTTSEEEEEDSDEETLDGSSIFIHRRRRNQVDSSSVAQNPLTPLEQALDSFLAAYYESEHDEDDDSSKDLIVEYWCRQEHLNLEAHADVDEVYFEQQQRKGASAEKAFRYPKIGHVLYLTKPSLGRGPTCVFPPTENEPKTGSIADEISSVVTIPAVPGRVLRFPGNALHAVPKAADVWFSKGTETFKDDDDDEEDDNDFEDDWDYEDDDDDSERSVILFNAWEVTSYNNNETKAMGGPMGVPMDPILQNPTDLELVDMMMSSVDIADSGVQVDEDFVRGMVDYAKRQKQELLEDWRANYSDAPTTATANVIYSKVHCQAKEHWSMAHVAPSQMISTERGTIRVPLMGDALRRKHPKKTISWIVPSSFQEGVNDSHQPYEFPLSIAEH